MSEGETEGTHTSLESPIRHFTAPLKLDRLARWALVPTQPQFKATMPVQSPSLDNKLAALLYNSPASD